MVVGKRLAERWNLPAVIRECIWLHGQLPEALPATVKNPRMINLITLADLIVREQHLGYSGNYAFTISQDRLIEAIGLRNRGVDAAMQQLVERIEPRARPCSSARPAPGAVSAGADAQANQELGRVSGQLAAKNRRLAVRAKFSSAQRISGRTSAGSPPQAVLQAIGQTRRRAGRQLRRGVFADAGQDFAEVCSSTNRRSIRNVAGRLPQALRMPRDGGDGPCSHAGDELDGFCRRFRPGLAGEQRFWICLEADGAASAAWSGARRRRSPALGAQAQELTAMAGGWALALRTAQIREESRALAEQLAEANRRLQVAQNEILRSQMMISVGEMAAGAAHEMNNPLAVISGRSQLLAAQLTDPKHKAMAHLIHEQSHRLSEIITELMDFAKPVPPKLAGMGSAELIARALHDAKQHTDPADRTIEVTMGDVPAGDGGSEAGVGRDDGSDRQRPPGDAIQQTDT